MDTNFEQLKQNALAKIAYKLRFGCSYYDFLCDIFKSNNNLTLLDAQKLVRVYNKRFKTNCTNCTKTTTCNHCNNHNIKSCSIDIYNFAKENYHNNRNLNEKEIESIIYTISNDSIFNQIIDNQSHN